MNDCYNFDDSHCPNDCSHVTAVDELTVTETTGIGNLFVSQGANLIITSGVTMRVKAESASCCSSIKQTPLHSTVLSTSWMYSASACTADNGGHPTQVCLDCLAGEEATAYNQGACSKCAIGQFSTGGSVCTNCDAGQFATGGAGTCTTCEVGRYSRPGSGVCDHCDVSLPEG